MDQATIDDLKQFMTTLITQQTSDLRDDIDELRDKMSTMDKRLNTKIDDLTAFVTESIDTANETSGKQLEDHERRITKLEQVAA